MRFLVAMDSFKGSLNSAEANFAVQQGLLEAQPTCQVQCFAIADGGEGSVQALVQAQQGHLVTCKARDPLGRTVSAQYGLLDQGKTAIIEMAAASGLPLLDPSERNPLYTSSLGTGDLICDALNRGIRNFVIAIGGSATNDCGMGMLEALGVRFLDDQGKPLDPIGKNLGVVTRIDGARLHPALSQSQFDVACDVSSPLYGPMGAAYIFAPQKGASPEEVAFLDQGLQHFAQVVEQYLHIPAFAHVPGSGAAGGLGAALRVFLHAELKPGIQIFMEKSGLLAAIPQQDILITGEGKLDAQTTMGKVPIGLARAAQARQVPVVVIAGSIPETLSEIHAAGIDAAFPLVNETLTLAQAMEPHRAQILLQARAAEISRLIQIGHRAPR